MSKRVRTKCISNLILEFIASMGLNNFAVNVMVIVTLFVALTSV